MIVTARFAAAPVDGVDRANQAMTEMNLGDGRLNLPSPNAACL